MASVHAYSSCIDSADLAGDGEWRLVVAGADRRVKVWAGTSLVSEVDLPEPPVALRAFYGDADTPNRRPFLAVAAGAHVYIYRNLRPYYKFTPPSSRGTEGRDGGPSCGAAASPRLALGGTLGI